ncbi:MULTISPECIES: hypothetical protein [unclassified Amycolatopsis]|uniref:hypothetical protein n=1 Tax=unclassified Amycolatopsis TaxID=2618356 RepID=UPI001C6A012C|nr:hypothetical protein [Amycolatopsis sp. DSM 110486]QYN20387.1 hypothetical protein K1T34_49120 [Amycolatopsis sp. DSM 110486]
MARSAVWRRQVWLSSPALLVRSIAQAGQGAVSLVADQITPLDLKSLAAASHDFR